VSLLSEAERLALELSRVPRAELRLKNYMLKFTIAEKQAEAKKVGWRGGAGRGGGLMGAAETMFCTQQLLSGPWQVAQLQSPAPATCAISPHASSLTTLTQRPSLAHTYTLTPILYPHTHTHTPPPPPFPAFRCLWTTSWPARRCATAAPS
jgi:hypothetical protein